MEILNKNQMKIIKLRNIISEMENNNNNVQASTRLDTAEERTSELKTMLIKITQTTREIKKGFKRVTCRITLSSL